ncbi:MAG: type II toxin-antitoxin system HicB family antitoxin [Candidatus Cloacimonetes bacterium]|nr:type II toxin-antitoxin system HicB family antitoxin [Candidatus Cloacimonadota bacterium]
MKAKLAMVCIKQDNGSYFAICPDIKGCFTQGDTYDDACKLLQELAEATVQEDYDEDEKEFILQPKNRIFSEFEIEVK